MTRTTLVPPARLTDWARRLVAAPSPQTDLFEREPAVQGFLAGPVVELLDEIGLPHRRDGMGSVIVEIGPEGGPSLMFMAYAMTHPANRMADPFGATLVDGGTRLRGRGVAEQKGALAAALAAVAAMQDRALGGRLVLAITSAGETGRHDAAASVLDVLGFVPDMTVIVVGTSGRLALANKGRIDVEVAVRGRAAHSSTPSAGIDAIEGARRVLDRVLALDMGARAHPGLGQATLAATSIRSWPEATHTIQDEVRLVFDRRLLPGDDPEAAFAAIARAADIGPPWEVDCRRGPHMFPAEIAADGRFARAVTAGCLARGLSPPAPFYSHGALDAGLFCAKGAEAALWGPGETILWHSDEESIALADLQAGAEGYLGLIETVLCSAPRRSEY
ncbi:MAG: M20 family metallopeptidase [Pikeienuella sp.]|uniref:M20 family metallopeptidase n=1 Tax=Pikeienuella sp. TaxID=2831957 RepID=UPI003918ABC1